MASATATELQCPDLGLPVDAGAKRPAWLRRYVAFLVVLDAVAIVIASLVAQFVRFGGLDQTLTNSEFVVSYWLVTATVAMVWVAAMGMAGAYHPRVVGVGAEEYRRVGNAGLRVLAAVAISSYAFQLQLARGVMAIALPLGVVLTLVARYSARRWLHRRRAQGACVRQVVVVGLRFEAVDLIRHFDRASYAGFRVAGACVPGPRDELEIGSSRVPVLGDPEGAAQAVVDAGADAVAVASLNALERGTLRRLAWQLEGSGVELIVAPALTDVAGPRISIRPVSGLPLLHVEEPQLSGPARFAKECFDRVVAAAALVVLSPLLACIALLVRLTSPGPAFYRQVRVGRHGREFVLWKFRTMTDDADARGEALAHLNEHDGLLFKIRDDPRRTRVGRKLRRLSVDELPQLWNVVLGHMSIVGPRPPLPSEVCRYGDDVRRRLLVKPGLTGLWQVSGRAELSWDEAVRLDLYYVENWSPAMDALILWKTAAAVVHGRGAY